MGGLRSEYKLIMVFEEILPTLKPESQEKVKEIIIEKKRDLRRIRKRSRAQDRRCIKDYGIDGYVERIELPEEIKTKEQAEEWFDKNERRDYIPSPYDCSGQLFTCWHNTFAIRDRFVVYHRIARDV